MSYQRNSAMVGLGLLLAVNLTAARGVTLLSEPFDGVEWSSIATLGWVKDSGNAGDNLCVRTDWAIDGGGKSALGNLTPDGTWLTYRKTFSTHTLAPNEVVTATVAFRGGISGWNKFVLLGNTNFLLSRSLGDQISNGYEGLDSNNTSFGFQSVQATWWQLYDQPGYFKMLASRREVQFFYKDANHPEWTLLGTSPTGLNTVSGVQIAGKSTPNGATYLQFDSVLVDVSPQAEAPVFSPAGGYISGRTAITLTTVTPNASIYYTLDGTLPTSAATLYTGPVTVTEGMTLKAVAVAAGYVNSSITSQTYMIPSNLSLLAESFNGTDYSSITSLGWIKDGGNAADGLYVRSDWSIDNGGQSALGEVTQNSVWLTYHKSLASAYALSDTDVVTATICFRGGIGAWDKFVLLGDTNYIVSRSLGDQAANGYECLDSNTMSFGFQSVQATWWQLYDQPASYKIAASRKWVRFYFKDANHSDWALLGTSPNGINTITGVQIGAMSSPNAATYAQFDSVNVEVAMARGNSLFYEPFEGTERSEITSLGWTREAGNAGDGLYVRTDWPIDNGGQSALSNLTPNGNWLTYSRTLPAYALADNDVVTATVSFRDGVYTSNKFVILGDKNFTLTRSLSDRYYACSDSQNGTVGTASLETTWWQLYDKPAYYKIVATRNRVQFFYKDYLHPTWTLLGSSPNGINTITGLQIGGKGVSGGSYTCVQFDSIEISALGQTPILDERFSSTNPLSRWSLVHIRGNAALGMSAASENGNPMVQLTVQGTGSVVDSFYTSLPPLTGVRGRLKLEYRYKATRDLSVYVSISNGFGCIRPYVRYGKTFVSDNQWHDTTMIFDVAGVIVSNPVLEFLVIEEGSSPRACNGDTIKFDDVRVTRLVSATPYAEWRYPGSRVLIDRTPSQTVVLDLVNPTGQSRTFDIGISPASGGSPVYQHTQSVTNRQTLSIDAGSFPVGSYEVSVRAAGLELGPWSLKKYPYRSNAVLIHNGVPYVNGEPFLVLGLYHTGDYVMNIINAETPGTLTRSQLFQDLVARGFNTVNSSYEPAPIDFYQSAHQYGLKVVACTTNQFSRVNAVKDEPNVFGWYGYDEPGLETTDACVTLYEQYKEIDPYHPVMTAFCDSGLGYGSRRLVDMAMPDVYPISGPTGDFGSAVSLHMGTNREILLDNDPTTCLIFVPQLFTADGQWAGYSPTYAQVRAEVYTAMYYGAKGFFYYGLYTPEALAAGMELNPNRKHWFLPESSLWNQIGTLNQELIALKDAILLGQKDSSVTINTAGSVLGRGMALPNGQRYILIVNPSSNAQSGIQISGLASGEYPAAEFGSPTPTQSGNQWIINLSGYGVGVYIISSQL